MTAGYKIEFIGIWAKKALTRNQGFLSKTGWGTRNSLSLMQFSTAYMTRE